MTFDERAFIEQRWRETDPACEGFALIMKLDKAGEDIAGDPGLWKRLHKAAVILRLLHDPDAGRALGDFRAELAILGGFGADTDDDTAHA